MSVLSEIPVVIFCGGRGARFDSETEERPKPLIEVAGKPIVQHIIDSFVSQGFREFILPTGYLGGTFIEYFSGIGSMFSWHEELGRYYFKLGSSSDPMFVKCCNTGIDAHVGERLWAIRDLISDRRFVMTYGDGLSDVRMEDVISLHDKGPSHPLLTATAVCPPGRFGMLSFATSDLWSPGYGTICGLQEKPRDAWINGGFMVVERRFIDSYLAPHPLTGEILQLEAEAMHECARDGLMRAHRHTGYWRCMDTRRDREQIENDVEQLGCLPWLP